MKHLDTEYDLENTLACAIAEWFEIGMYHHISIQKNFTRLYGAKER